MELGEIEMLEERLEIDGLNSVGEALRNSSSAFKDRAIAGPNKIKQIQVVKRGKNRTIYFLIF